MTPQVLGAAASSAASVRSGRSASSGSKKPSQIVAAYRQAAQLFLTRRLPEALSTILPIITPPARLEPATAAAAAADAAAADAADPALLAPVAKASRGTRIKVWSFYLTFLNAVVELGPDEGKRAFGTAEWRQLVASARDGTIWDTLVCDGYAGDEGRVDPEVVINLSTLLLTHSPSQHLNQTRLENYLAATSDPFQHFPTDFPPSSPNSPAVSARSPSHGTSTPRDINTKLRLIELYALHVLPRNDKWSEAADFIRSCELLYDDRRDAFLNALDALKDEVEHTRQREEELVRLQAQQMAAAQQAEADRIERHHRERKQKADSASRPNPAGSSGRRPAAAAAATAASRSTPSRDRANSAATDRSAASSASSARSPAASAAATSSFLGPLLPAALSSRLGALGRVLTPPSGLFAGKSPLPTAALVILLLCALAPAAARDRVRRAVAAAWDKLKRTVGMGVKVSYV